MVKTRAGLIFLTTLLIFGVLSIAFWDFMRETVAVPLYYLLWVGDLALKSVPQGFFLGLLVFIGAVIAFNVVTGARSRASRPLPVGRPQAETRYLMWARLSHHLYDSRFYRHKFAFEARKLILSILAYQEELDVVEVEDRVIDGSLPVPDAVLLLVLVTQLRGGIEAATGMKRLWARLTGADQTVVADPLIDQQVAAIIAFIEYRLEIVHAADQP